MKRQDSKLRGLIPNSPVNYRAPHGICFQCLNSSGSDLERGMGQEAKVGYCESGIIPSFLYLTLQGGKERKRGGEKCQVREGLLQGVGLTITPSPQG